MSAETEYYRLMPQVKKEVGRFRRDNLRPWMVIKAMIKREPNHQGLGIWGFIECAMLGWQLKEDAHEYGVPKSAPANPAPIRTYQEASCGGKLTKDMDYE